MADLDAGQCYVNFNQDFSWVLSIFTSGFLTPLPYIFNQRQLRVWAAVYACFDSFWFRVVI